MDDHQRAVANRLKTARGHIGGILSRVEADGYCPEVMKQLAAVQGLLEGASRIMLRRHLETCVAKAMREGRTAEIVDELMETLKFDKRVFASPPPEVAETLLAGIAPTARPPAGAAVAGGGPDGGFLVNRKDGSA